VMIRLHSHFHSRELSSRTFAHTIADCTTISLLFLASEITRPIDIDAIWELHCWHWFDFDASLFQYFSRSEISVEPHYYSLLSSYSAYTTRQISITMIWPCHLAAFSTSVRTLTSAASARSRNSPFSLFLVSLWSAFAWYWPTHFHYLITNYFTFALINY
jgi:hypothetical protein